MIIFSRARASSEDILTISAIRQGSEALTPDARLFQFDRNQSPGNEWAFRDVELSVQDIRQVTDFSCDPSQAYLALLSTEGDILHMTRPDNYQERIIGAGTTYSDAKRYGKVLKLRQIRETLFVIGAGGQVYVRSDRDRWSLLTDSILFDPKAFLSNIQAAPSSKDREAYMAWMDRSLDTPVSPNCILNDLTGLSEESLYICGETSKKPVLAYWNGETLEELKVPMEEAALTGIYIEDPENVWVCGREGVLLHGSHTRGFNPVPGSRGLNLFHHITPYRGKLIMPASVRSGGLWEYDPNTGDFGRFEPRLPRLTPPPEDGFEPHGGPFFAQAIGDVLWVVAPRDIFRFDGSEWERIKHPDLP